MSIPFTSSISPKGETTDEKLNNLVRQLTRQNTELKLIIEDLYKQISEVKKI